MDQFALVTPGGAEVVEVKHYRISESGVTFALVVTVDPPAMWWAPVDSLSIIPNT